MKTLNVDNLQLLMKIYPLESENMLQRPTPDENSSVEIVKSFCSVQLLMKIYPLKSNNMFQRPTPDENLSVEMDLNVARLAC